MVRLDLQKTIVVGNEFRHPLRESARHWIAANFSPGRYFGVVWDQVDIVVFRNRVIRDIVLPAEKPGKVEWALFLDNDVTITTPGIDGFLALEADVGACRCAIRSNAWTKPDSFHTTFWFARIEVFRRVSPPWFMFTYSADGCDLIRCECQYFRDKCVEAGFVVRSGGWCGHASEGKWCG